MSSVLPLFRDCLREGFAPVKLAETTLPELRSFSVTMCFEGQTHHKHVKAFKSADAISTALNDFFCGESEMPDEMSVKAHPANVLRAA